MLLLTPGLITDTIGFLLFVAIRAAKLGQMVVPQRVEQGRVHIRTFGLGMTAPVHGRHLKRAARRISGESENIVDAEFETIDPDHKKDEEDGPVPLTDEKDRRGGSNGRKRNSPWRKP